MNEKNESAATAADDGAAAPAAAEVVASDAGVVTDVVVDPGKPALTDEVSEGELVDLRESALEDEEDVFTPTDSDIEILQTDRGKQLSAEGHEPEDVVAIVEAEHEELLRQANESTRIARLEEEQRRQVTLGDTVYYGDGTGQVWPAIVTHVYDPSVEGGAVIGSANTPQVDLQVFKRKHVCDVENVSFHSFDPPRSLNGWIFKA